MRYLIFTFFFTLFSFNLIAVLATDSLLIELKNTPENKEKTLLLNELSKTLLESDIDSSLIYAKRGLDLATEIGYTLGVAENAASLARYYVINDSLAMAIEYYMQASKHFEDLEMQFDAAQMLMVIGNIYLSQSNYSEALMYYQKSQKNVKKMTWNQFFLIFIIILV